MSDLNVLEQIENRLQTTEKEVAMLRGLLDGARQELQHEEIEKLEQHLGEARVKFSAMKEVAGDAWEELKQLIEQLLDKVSADVSKHKD